MLRRTIGQNIWVESYNVLFSLEIIIEMNILKWESQWPRLIQALTILTMFDRHLSPSIITLRCLQKIQSGLGVNKLLYLLITLLNSSFKNDGHSKGEFEGILSKSWALTWQFYAELNVLYRACHISSSLYHK